VSRPALTPERILAAAEDVLRRFGPEKATVVDVARALGVSHGSVYRHFTSKAALRDAVVRRWLEPLTASLEALAAEKGPAPERLRRWLDNLIAAKRKRAADDAELFATYFALATQAREVVQAHIDAMERQVSRIIADGVARQEFNVANPLTAARAVLGATTRFHNPVHASEWSDPAINDDLDAVWRLLVSGLQAHDRPIVSSRRGKPKLD
jgi:AcrR family transcriptional regulator